MSLRIMAVVASLLCAALVLAADDAAKPPNLVKNGGFEEAAEGKPAGWFIAIAEGGKAEAAVITDNVKEGKQAAKFTGDGEWAVLVSPKVAVEKGKRYTLTGHARAAKGTGQLKFDYFDKAGEYLGSTYGAEVFANTWEKDTLTDELSDYPAATHLSAAGVGTGQFEVYFDDFTVTAK